jgi:hypothetical protein
MEDIGKKVQEKHSKKEVTHYTPTEVVILGLSMINFDKDDIVIDAGSGKNKIWYNNISVQNKFEYEIEDGNDYLKSEKECDWTIGNPPFNLGWKFTEHALKHSRKGVLFLLSMNAINSNFTPKRLEIMKTLGFGITEMKLINISLWFGRYILIKYEKGKKRFCKL